MVVWNFADAKNRFSEVVNLALTKGPQRIRRNEDEVFVISATEYNRMRRKSTGLKAHLFNAPSFHGVDITRDRSSMRDVKP